MRQMLVQYAIVLAVFLAIDAVWLSTAGRTIYVSEIGSLLRERPNFAVAFIFYAIYAMALLVFVIWPHVADVGYGRAILFGAFFGLAAYATYDLTNLATLKGFTAKIALIDMAWGAVLSASVTCGSIYIFRLLRL